MKMVPVAPIIVTPKKSSLILIFLLSQLLLPTILSSSPSSSSNFISPVRNLDASLAASAAQTTVVAVQSFRDDDDIDSEDCVVLLSRTPPILGRELMFNLTRSTATSTANTVSQDDDDDNTTENDNDVHLMPILSRGSVQMKRLNENERRQQHQRRRRHTEDSNESRNLHILQPSSGLCLAVTGFALDGTHLVRYIAESVSNHEYMYGCGGSLSSSSSIPDVHKIVREDLAPKMMDAAFAGGGRPFGVDLLMVGSDRRRGGSAGSDSSRTTNSMVLYTVDPSGNWKHWGGGGTCIGKGAELVRKQLVQTLHCKTTDTESTRDDDDDDDDEPSSSSILRKQQGHYPKTWARALEVAMEATFKAMDLEDTTAAAAAAAANDHEQNPNNKATADYEAIVLFGSDRDACRGDASRCAIIDQQFIAQMYRKCAERCKKTK